MKTKICYMCKRELQVSEFKTKKSAQDGLQHQCIECQKDYRRRHYLKNKEKYLKKASFWRVNFRKWWNQYKQQFSCEECGESHPSCIDFHHHDEAEKDDNISNIVNYCNKKRLLNELKKCIPLCANCHRKAHWESRNASVA